MIIEYCKEYIEDILKIWCDTLTHDKVNRERLQKQLLDDPNFDENLFLIEQREGKIEGFIIGIIRKVPYYDRGLQSDTGWIIALGGSDTGVLQVLIEEMERRLRASGVRKIIFGMYSPGYLMPGLDIENYPAIYGLLKERGYTFGQEHTAMYRTLFDYSVPQKYRDKELSAQGLGYKFLPYSEDKQESLLEFVQKNFTAGWVHNTRALIAQNKAQEHVWLCQSSTDEIVGFAQRGMWGMPCRFGPFGIHPEHRNHSLGSVLLSKMLYDMSCKGLYIVYFMSTDEAGRRMYERHGFLPYRTFTDAILSI